MKAKLDRIEQDRLDGITPIILGSKTLSRQRKDEILRLLEGGKDIRRMAEVDRQVWKPASEVAAMLEISLTTLLRWVHDGKVDSQKVGDRLRLIFLPSALAANAASKEHYQRRRGGK